ncbi:MAG: cytochrome c oxidase assembly protein, partial [Chloroflexi bacterium]|nr:cytochrome c oxidase assembly protein [Chloroflexota bacterium]
HPRLRTICLACAIALGVMARSVAVTAAHTGDEVGIPIGRGGLTTALILLGLVVPAALYVRGTAKIWHRAGVGRGVRRYQAAAFLAGSIVLGVALLSPLDAMSAELFSAHMVQHIVLILVAAPLLVMGAPLAPILWAFPGDWRLRFGRLRQMAFIRATGSLLAHPLVVGLVGTGALWLWHTPSLYEAALRTEAFHAAEHVSFLAAALVFWWVVFPSGRRQGHHGAAFLLIFVTMLQSGALGALITFARSPWYAVHADTVAAWGLTPLEDQQLAGVIMWVPMGTVYLVAALWLVATWLRSLERSSPANERPPGTAESHPNADGATAALARAAGRGTA